MRFVLLLLVLAPPLAATNLLAQSSPLSQLSFPGGKPVLSVRTYVFEPVPALSWEAAKPASTCPMPIAHTNSAKEDPMPVARGGTPEPMPIARSSCWNPLFPEY